MGDHDGNGIEAIVIIDSWMMIMMINAYNGIEALTNGDSRDSPGIRRQVLAATRH